MPRSKRTTYGHGYAVGRKTPWHDTDCQRCGRRFSTNRHVPYCPECFTAKRDERERARRLAAGLDDELRARAGNVRPDSEVTR